jgi:CDP-4-dehydro-6-deoxyglucose reductase
MFNISLKNGKSFTCDSNTTIFEAAKSNGIILEHSCLTARCRSCTVQILSGTTVDKLDDLVLSPEEKTNNWTLSCNSIPTTDVELDIEDLGDIKIFEKKIIPAKIQNIKKLNDTVIEVSLRLPLNSNFAYNSGQYVNIIKGQIKRSYSIANAYQENALITFFIKKYENGLMSDYWFSEAKTNDLLRIEGPIGSFFLRQSEQKNIIFLATGTGIAPIKAILENILETSEKHVDKNLWLFVGGRHESDLFWNPKQLKVLPNFHYIPVLSRYEEGWNGEKGYVQDIVIKQGIDLSSAQVYACGSNDMIQSSKKYLIENGLKTENFFSDVFVATN